MMTGSGSGSNMVVELGTWPQRSDEAPFSFAGVVVLHEMPADMDGAVYTDLLAQMQAEAASLGIAMTSFDFVREACSGLHPVCDTPCIACVTGVAPHDWILVTARKLHWDRQ